jgi:septum formation protein
MLAVASAPVNAAARIMAAMASRRLVLASASPRRRELLARLGLPFEVAPAELDESVHPGESAPDYARRVALAKARAVAAGASDALVLGADTTVVLDGAALGKPASEAEARAFLLRLRGRRHEVITALALVDAASGATWAAEEVTGVWMRAYTEAEMASYIATGDPMDKAGAYAIQHPGFRPVARLEGSEDNVIGLPLARVEELLARAGVPTPIGRSGPL